ncbi:MAG: response regulator [Bacteroidota bacterium]|nr:response regulator [Candidatus Kapabacteria bacterium]MDW8219777.1 response regulator [Bacteroidota bacterium]
MSTICLIEDDTITRKLFVLLLERAGFDVKAFGDGTAALSWLSTHSVDAVVSNIILPEGMNGIDILHRVRALFANTRIPVVALTSFAKRGEREQYLSIGFDGCIAKPINPQTFADELRVVIHMPRS